MKKTIKQVSVGKKDLFSIRLDDIVETPGFNARINVSDEDESIRDLAASIAENGVLRPIIIEMNNEGKAALIDGHRRVCAARYASKVLGSEKAKVLPAMSFKRYATDKDKAYAVIIYNDGSEPLTPLELSKQVSKIRAMGESVSNIAKSIGKTRQYVYDLLEIGELGHDVKEKIMSGSLSATSALKEDRKQRRAKAIQSKKDERGVIENKSEDYSIIRSSMKKLETLRSFLDWVGESHQDEHDVIERCLEEVKITLENIEEKENGK